MPKGRTRADSVRPHVDHPWLNPPLAHHLLRRILVTLVVGLGALTLGALLFGNLRTGALAGTAVAVAVGLMLLERKGHTRSASIVALFAFLAVVGYAMATAHGVNDSAIVVLPGVFLLASILLGPRWLFVVTGVASVMVASIGYAEVHHYLQTGSRLRYDNVFEVLTMLWLTSALVHFVVKSLGQALLEVRRAHDSTREVFNATSEAIVIHDANTGVVLDANETMLTMYGLEREEIAGLEVPKISADEPQYDEAHVQELMRRAVEEGPQSFPWRSKRKNGELFWTEVSLRFARIASEPRVLAVVRDVSERRELERRVHDAEKLRAVGQLAGGVAHDFNNQLVGIIGNAHFLCQRLEKGSRLSACAEAVLDSGQRAADLTRKLLAFARKGKERAEVADLHELMTRVVALVEHSVDKRISIELDLTAEFPTTLGDPSALQNALLNLAINARDAMPNGGVLRFASCNIELGPQQREEAGGLSPGHYIQLEVSDTGTGMSSEVLARAFDPFFTTKETGTGMGLAAVYGTVREHEGSVVVESKPGRGSTFRLWLPVTHRARSEEAGGAPPEPKSARGRVLLVDDEPAVVRVAAEVLRQVGYVVTTCPGGREAVQRYQSEPFDLVVLDITMPDLDGVDVLEQLKKHDPGVRILFMSGHASDAVRVRLRDHAEVRVVAKPFSPSQLATAVREALA